MRRLPHVFQSLMLTSHEYSGRVGWASKSCRRCDLSLDEARKGERCDDGVPCASSYLSGYTQGCRAAPVLVQLWIYLPVLPTLVSQKAAGSNPLSFEDFDRHPSTVAALFIKISASTREQYAECLRP